MKGEILLKLNHITKLYPGVTALDDGALISDRNQPGWGKSPRQNTDRYIRWIINRR